MNERAPLWPIAISRILIGLLWLVSLRWKLPPDFAPAAGRGLMDWFELEAQYPAFEIYGSVVASVVIPNFRLFAWIVFLLELLTGISLLAGLLTRLGAAAGLLMSLNLAVGLLEVPGEWPWSYIMMVMWHSVFIVTAAGRLWGIDARLRQSRYRKRVTWLI